MPCANLAEVLSRSLSHWKVFDSHTFNYIEVKKDTSICFAALMLLEAEI